VCDAVHSKGGLKNIEVNKGMISRVRNARSEYELARKERAAQNKEKEAEEKKRRAVVDEVRELKAKKLKLMLEKDHEMEVIDNRLKELSGH